MELSEDDVIRILKLLDESDFDEIRLETGDLKLVVRKRGHISSTPEQESVPSGLIELTAPDKSATSEKGTDTVKEAPTPSESSALPVGLEALEEATFALIKAPMLGTFYRAPKSSAPPFVDVDTFVTEGDTVCLIEVMKCFISIKAGMRGHIVKVCAENGQMVEFGQELFLVKPEKNDEEKTS